MTFPVAISSVVERFLSFTCLPFISNRTRHRSPSGPRDRPIELPVACFHAIILDPSAEQKTSGLPGSRDTDGSIRDFPRPGADLLDFLDLILKECDQQSFGLLSRVGRRSLVGPLLESQSPLGRARSNGAVPFFMLATGALLFALRPLHPEKTLWGLRAVLEMSFMSLVTVIAYVSWDIAMRKGNVVLVAACSYFIPLFSTLVSSLYLRITPGLTLWLGCGLIILGSLISWNSMKDPIPTQLTQRTQT